MATPISTITPEQLHAAQLRGDRPVLLDVRTAAEYHAGHIPGSQLFPIGELRPDEVTRRFKHAAHGHQEPLYITCRSGARARQAAERLQLAGFTNLALVEGGTQGWEQYGLPVRRCGNAISLERQVQIAIGSLLFRGTGRADFQNGDPAARYDSLFGILAGVITLKVALLEAAAVLLVRRMTVCVRQLKAAPVKDPVKHPGLDVYT